MNQEKKRWEKPSLLKFPHPYSLPEKEVWIPTSAALGASYWMFL